MFSAVELDRCSCIREFVSRGASVNVKDRSGMTLLMLAACLQHSIAALVSAGADLNCTDNSGRTLYDFCRNKSEIARVVDEALHGKVPEIVKPSGMFAIPLNSLWPS